MNHHNNPRTIAAYARHGRRIAVARSLYPVRRRAWPTWATLMIGLNAGLIAGLMWGAR